MPQPTRLSFRILPWLCFFFALPALAQDAPVADVRATPAAISWVKLHGHRYTVELALNDEQRMRGLMFRTHMNPDRGMLFVHDAQEPLAYWMKNTKIALDIFYFDSKRRLVSVSRNTPPCDLGDACPPYRSEGPALYVLELNAGIADRLQVKKGDRLAFGPDIPVRPAAPSP
jgi:uncharacterized membrane protein (UPF0127 family)